MKLPFWERNVKSSMNNSFDVIITGGGPAGVSAALYAVRAGFSVCILENDGGSLKKTEKIENYYGFPKAVSGAELYERGLSGARELGVKIIKTEVFSIGFSESGFGVDTDSGKYEGKTVIIAVGAKRKKPSIPNLKAYEGTGVSYCAVCDAFFYRGRDVAVLGNKEYAFHEAKELLGLASSVTILTNGEEIGAYDERFKVNTKKIESLFGDEVLEGIRFFDGTTLNLSGLFIAEGTAGGNELAKKAGIVMQNDNIVISEKGETNISGIFAAGDCTGGFKQIAKSVYEGMNAGLGTIEYLRRKK